MTHSAKHNVTLFQQQVYDATSNIPKGKVTTYKLLAKKIGCASPRAVGQALRVNPFAPKIPCHRVISSDLSHGGYSGARVGPKIQNKLRLLKKEGVEFEDNRLTNPKQLHKF